MVESMSKTINELMSATKRGQSTAKVMVNTIPVNSMMGWQRSQTSRGSDDGYRPVNVRTCFYCGTVGHGY